MSLKIKLAAYAVLLILAIWFGCGFYSNYKANLPAPESPPTDTSVPPAKPPPASTTPSSTNDAAALSNNDSGASATNDAGTPTNAASTTTNAAAPEPAKPAPVAPAPAPAAPAAAHQGRMIGYLGALILTLIGLGLLLTYDVTHLVGGAAVDALLDDQGEGMRDPDYEKAEQIWANGKHLEAIQLMRDFLKKNPREQYAALRIAEIYEKDLQNYLAAALEYEELLKKRLEPERWGWAAIHLCNLYSKLNEQDKARALLQRVVDEQPGTAAAQKARQRLGVAEPEAGKEGAAKAESSTEGAEGAGESNLPPGFRPKN